MALGRIAGICPMKMRLVVLVRNGNFVTEVPITAGILTETDRRCVLKGRCFKGGFHEKRNEDFSDGIGVFCSD